MKLLKPTWVNHNGEGRPGSRCRRGPGGQVRWGGAGERSGGRGAPGARHKREVSLNGGRVAAGAVGAVGSCPLAVCWAAAACSGPRRAAGELQVPRGGRRRRWERGATSSAPPPRVSRWARGEAAGWQAGRGMEVRFVGKGGFQNAEFGRVSAGARPPEDG